MLLGKRVQKLRGAHNWSQEEFAAIAGLHRTYVGQVERAEKNLSFDNLVKISTPLGVTLSELLRGLENGDDASVDERKRASRGSTALRKTPELLLLDVRKVLRRLSTQLSDVNRTIHSLEDLADGSDRNQSGNSQQGRSTRRR
jgi:transcriptional regulator with XRE-family HTH domain